MNKPLKQHLIDPEICIRCYTCEMTCPIGAIQHDDNNVVVDPDICNFCMDCIPVCPTGSIDEWRVVETPYSLEQQYEMDELPEQEDITLAAEAGEDDGLEAHDDAIAALLAEAHKGAGGKARAPASASKPTINLYNLGNPATATVQGNYRLTDAQSDGDVRHIILDLAKLPFPVLEGQSIGIIAPGTDAEGKPHLPRLYSVSSPRDGERPGFNNVSLTVKREDKGLCSNYVCDLAKGDEVRITGPFGSTFLLPSDANAHLLMICTGTGSAPFRGFTMRRQREMPSAKDSMTLVFGARSPRDLPYFGPLKKVPDSFMRKEFAFSRQDGEPKQYVQDKLREQSDHVAGLLASDTACIYICGLKAMEQGVEEALRDIARGAGLDWAKVRDDMRDQGRYHVETY
ncbi:benzoyl-CoA 2,3-epoxidase subunit BoxA [Sulfitobacter sabulilitoris]|uniref:Benzoyl-CoA 2,3-epoxidase subunit BoxA n=1 Tax=Sulfitobacter sabulilitoris TaxID=2562655 RepID=A0A5S3PFS7_9RHOB|nr:benzoyl-CoA 2,3-epoxidase subunit BoxA [Sulfitobacter sabulilitoris]TMM52922.1 benzoyl-CoA 2,3-epoxidase subunit BoxA [Sulfitobacter sabulilitoris]